MEAIQIENAGCEFRIKFSVTGMKAWKQPQKVIVTLCNTDNELTVKPSENSRALEVTILKECETAW